MKNFRMLALMINFYSVSAVAGHVCTVQLAHTEDLYNTAGEKVVETKHGIISSKIFGTIVVEHEKVNRKGIVKEAVHMDLHGVVDGWDGQQESSFAFVRKTYKNGKRIGWENFDKRITVKGTSRVRDWFDNYKVEIDCVATDENLE